MTFPKLMVIPNVDRTRLGILSLFSSKTCVRGSHETLFLDEVQNCKGGAETRILFATLSSMTF